MKKRVLTLFLCTAMILVSGCGNIPKNQNTDTNVKVDTNVDVDTNIDVDADTNVDVDTNIDVDADTNVDVDTNTNQDLYSVTINDFNYRSTDSANSLLLESRYDSIHIEGDSYQFLSEAVETWNSENQQIIEQLQQEYITYAQEDAKNSEEFYGYSISSNLAIKRMDAHILSLTHYYDEYTGGVHPSYYTEGLNLDAETGELLTLESICTDYNAFSQAAQNYILEYLANSEYNQVLYENYQDMIAESWDRVFWYFSISGITIIYNPYDIAPYAAGPIEIILPWDTFSGYIKESYLPSQELGLTWIPLGKEVPLTINDSTHTLFVSDQETTYDSATDSANRVVIALGNDTHLIQEYFFSYLRSCYVIYQPTRTLLLLDGDMGSDDFVTILFDITQGTLKEVARIDASIAIPNVNTVDLTTYTNVLGTYRSTETYDLSLGQEFRLLDSEYSLDGFLNPIITTRELPVTDMENTEITLPVGTALIPIATDKTTYIRLTNANTSEEYTLYFTKEDFFVVIDGLYDHDYFEMLPYAG